MYVTWREIDVIRLLLVDGSDNKSIGKQLYLSEDTVKTHLRKILTKVQVANRTALAVAILRHQVVLVDPHRRAVLY